ncbi:MAG TPA: signal peptidase II [Fimbriimonadales bacterium]|nr:signal peptidase II [Fimbriimonadales bacterium]
MVISRKTKGWPFFAAASGLVIFDQLTKYLIRQNLAEGEYITVIPHAFDLTLVYNKGIAFGLLQGIGVFLSPFALVVAFIAWLGYARSRPNQKLFKSAMVLLAAGAVGNLVDRLVDHGKVTDFVDIKIIHIFNVADACITMAAVLLIIHWAFDFRAEADSAPKV